MAIVNTKSNIAAAMIGAFPDPEQVRGKPVVCTGTVTNTATDSASSTYHLCDVPAEAILGHNTGFGVSGWGFADIRIGTLTDNDALVTVAKAAGATVFPITQFGATHGKRLWEVLGLAAPPKDGMISLYAHAIAAATGAGKMDFEIHYRWR